MSEAILTQQATLNAALTTGETLHAILSTPAVLNAVLAQGPVVMNDYVFTVHESADEYIFTVRRGSETQNIVMPKGGGVAFETDETLSLNDGILSVNTADEPEADNTLPITSAAVHTTVGNINALLETI